MQGLTLIAMIAAGIFAGILITFTLKRDRARELCTSIDVHVIIFAMFPVLFYGTGQKMKLFDLKIEHFALMGEMFILFGITYLLCMHVIGPRLVKSMELSEEASTRVLVGFVVLACCTNTGHGHMLLMTVTNEKAITELSLLGFYPGYLWVIFLPQVLSEVKLGSDRGLNKPGYWVQKILLNPISYSCICGVLSQISSWLPITYLLVLGIRIWLVRSKEAKTAEDKPIPWAVMVVAVLVSSFAGHTSLFQGAMSWFPALVTFVTAITIGIKMTTDKLTLQHSKLVVAIIAFGILIAPALALIMGKLVFGATYEQAYILSYMSSQPPAYLGIVWLRLGKFGEEMKSMGEWAFVAQAILAYTLAAVVLPWLISFLY